MKYIKALNKNIVFCGEVTIAHKEIDLKNWKGNLTHSGFLPEERLAQVVSIKNLELDNSLYLRAKVFIYSSQNQTEEIDVVENSNWTKNEDGYYYYNELLSPLEKTTFSTFIIAPSQNFVTASWKKYIVTFVFESLDSSVDVENLWQNNPVQNV